LVGQEKQRLNLISGVLKMKQSQERFNYLMETRDEQRMILYLQHDSLTPDEKEATEAIVADLEAELEEYGLVFEKN